MILLYIEHIGYLEINNKFFSGVIIVDYPRIIDNKFMENIIYLDIPFNISMFYEPINKYEVIKKLTYHLGNVKSEIKTSSKNKEDYEYLNITYNDAIDIRKELQINNENIYNFYLYITIYDNDLQRLNQNINTIKSLLYSYGVISKVPYFRHISLYKATNPFNINPEEIKFDTKRNMISKTLSSFYPFISTNIYDIKGVLYGINNQNKSLIIIDRFDKKKYINSNMSIFGTSGAGKSYFIKLQIIRNSLLDIKQLVIDPEGEYMKVCNEVGGTYISLGGKNNYHINIFDIYNECDIESNNSILENKIQNLMIFFSMVLPEINNIEKAYLEEKIIEIYKEKGITFDNKTLYNYYENNKILLRPNIKNNKQFPIIQDLYDIILKDNKYPEMLYLLKPFISGRLKYLNNHTNFDSSNKILIIDISNIKEEFMDIHLFIIIELFWNIIKQDTNLKKIIYIDEIWRLIGQKSNSLSANFVVQIFKTIRKYNGAATAITQDISDLIINKNIYGKAIINNSYFKCIFKMDEENVKNLSELVLLSESEKIKINKIKRGECLLMLNNNNSILNICSSEYEKSIIEQGEGCDV